jgi:hypothetical protein
VSHIQADAHSGMSDLMDLLGQLGRPDPDLPPRLQPTAGLTVRR